MTDTCEIHGRPNCPSCAAILNLGRERFRVVSDEMTDQPAMREEVVYGLRFRVTIVGKKSLGVA